MLVVISQTTICDNCKHEWDTTDFIYCDGFVICPKCNCKNEIGVRITYDGKN